MTDNQDQPRRHVNGIWIPIEIWDNEELTAGDKLLLGEIDALTDKKNNKPCFASDTYLAERFKTTKSSIASRISRLRKSGYIKTISFNGRQRKIIVANPEAGFSNRESSSLKLTEQGSQIERPLYIEGEHSIEHSIDSSGKPGVMVEDTSLHTGKETPNTPQKESSAPKAPESPRKPSKPDPGTDKGKDVKASPEPPEHDLAWKDLISGVTYEWERYAGGIMPVKPILKSLKTLASKHGSRNVLKTWIYYLQTTEVRFMSWQSFVTKFKSYNTEQTTEPKKSKSIVVTSLDDLDKIEGK